MQVFHKLEDIPADFGPTLVSVGNFDGVHRAHRHVLPGDRRARAGSRAPRPWRSLSSRILSAFCARIPG